MSISKVIVLERNLLESFAFRSLSAGAIIVYLDFRMRCRIKPVKGRDRKKVMMILNNGEIVYTYAEAGKKNPPISKTRFMKSISELVEKGFMDITHSGTAGRKGDVNLYAISERWRKYGTPEFERKERPRDLRRGRGFAEVWRRKQLQSSVSKLNTETGLQYLNPNTETRALRH
jgi:hypothetical protein